jgi:hypothetical protein
MWARMLQRADDALFDLSQQGGGSDEAGYFEAMRELRRQREAVEEQCRQRMLADFDALARRAGRTATATDPSAGDSGLSLVDADALEGQLACEHLAAAVEHRHPQSLLRFNLALAKLLDAAEPDPQANPISPLRLSSALRDAVVPLVESIPARLVVLKWLERVLIADYGRLLEEMLAMLATRGVTVELPPPQRATDDGGAPAANHGDEAAEEPQRKAEAQARRAGGGAGRPGNGHSAVTVSDAPDELFVAMRAMFASFLEARRAGGGAGGTAGTGAGFGAGAGGAAAPRLEARVAIEMLTTMQAEPQPVLMGAIDNRQLELGVLLQQILLQRAAAAGLAPSNARLDEHDEQALALVGMLFDVLLDQGHFVREVRERFVRLIVPYAKVSLLDQRLFAHKTHPARRLLNALTEACDGNRGELPGDRELLLRVTAVIDMLLRDFAEDVGLFVTLEERFRGYLDQHRRRIALAERRTAEMQRGRERLEEARLEASLELASLVGDHQAPRPVAEFLRRDWTHHLTIAALRGGVDSDAYREARAAGVALWLSYLGCEQGRPVPANFGSSLLPVLQSGGQSGDAAKAAIEQLGAALHAAQLHALRGTRPASTPAAAEPAARSAPNPEPAFEIVSAGLEPEPETKPVPAACRAEPGLDAELQLRADPCRARPEDIERVRELKVGDWIEIVDAEGNGQPAKLSWISPISSRLLFVNRRGMRLCVLSPEEMAALVADGKLTLREVGTAFERALSQMIGRLKAEQPLPA